MICHPEARRFYGPKDPAVGFAFRVRFTWHRLQPVCFCLAFCGVRRFEAALPFLFVFVGADYGRPASGACQAFRRVPD